MCGDFYDYDYIQYVFSIMCEMIYNVTLLCLILLLHSPLSIIYLNEDRSLIPLYSLSVVLSGSDIIPTMCSNPDKLTFITVY